MQRGVACVAPPSTAGWRSDRGSCRGDSKDRRERNMAQAPASRLTGRKPSQGEHHVTQNLGLSHHGALDALLATHLHSLDFLSVRTGSLLDDAPGHDALCRDARAVDAPGAHDPATTFPPADPDLRALNLDAVRRIAIGRLAVDRDLSAHPQDDGCVGTLLTRLTGECRWLRGITIDLSPDAIRSIGTDGIVAGLDAMRMALPGRAGVVTFPGTTTTKPGLAAPRPRGYLPGHGRVAPMRLAHCAPEAETPPAASDAPPTSGGWSRRRHCPPPAIRE